MPKNKRTIIFVLICICLGFLLTRQFYLNKEVVNISQPEVSNSIAIEVAELIKTNTKLTKQISSLEEQKNKLDQSTVSSQASSDAVDEKLNDYKILLGITDIEGPGVEIIFNDRIDSTQVVDLINAVKNIGAEGIAINNQRFGPKSFIETGLFNPPTIVQVIGNKNLLKESLTRAGGIIEQIGTGKVEEKDNINLKSL